MMTRSSKTVLLGLVAAVVLSLTHWWCFHLGQDGAAGQRIEADAAWHAVNAVQLARSLERWDSEGPTEARKALERHLDLLLGSGLTVAHYPPAASWRSNELLRAAMQYRVKHPTDINAEEWFEVLKDKWDITEP